jgi:pyruvate kinase
MPGPSTTAPQLFSLPLQATQELPLWGPADQDPDKRSLKELIQRLDTVRVYAGRLEERLAAETSATDARYRESARNLLHYLALRHFDLRNIQERLAALGLSRLARTEPHTLASLYAVRRALERAARKRVTERLQPEPGVAFGEGTRLLATHTLELLGSKPQGRDVHIMVTLPAEAADDYGLVRGLMASGMDCARINCAHDGPAAWARMIDNISRAKRELGRPCKISMDLGGPKLRTGKLEPGPRVVRWKPMRDVCGRVVAPARIWLAPPGTPPPAGHTANATVPVTAEWLSQIEVGDKVEFVDARDAHRKVRIVACDEGGCWGEARHSAYVETGTVLARRPAGNRESSRGELTVPVGEIPPIEIPIILATGDTLILHRDPQPGTPTVYDTDGHVVAPAHISCTMPEVFTDAKAGELIRLDDGKMEGIIREVSEGEMRIEITLAKPGGAKLRGDKGINFPESRLEAAALTPKDLADLDFVAHHADMVAMSFVNNPSDVVLLQEELAKLFG